MTYSGKAAGNEPGVFEWAFLVERLRVKRNIHRPDINLLLPSWKKQPRDGSPGVYLAQSLRSTLIRLLFSRLSERHYGRTPLFLRQISPVTALQVA